MGILVLGAALRNSLWIASHTRLLQQALSKRNLFLRSAPGQSPPKLDVRVTSVYPSMADII